MELTLHLEHDCNLRCRYCYAGSKARRPMPFEVARRALELALEPGEPLGVTFSGGEPLLAWETVERVATLVRAECLRRHLPFLLRLATNGTLLDARKAAFLKEARFDVQVSLDGTAEAHDRNRRRADGSGSHRGAEAGLRLLQAAGVAPAVVAVVDPSNVDLLPSSIAYVAALGVPRVQIAPNPLATWSDEACAGFERGLAAAADWYAERLRHGPAPSLEPFDGLIARQVLGERIPGCDFGGELAVAPSGRLYPCDRLVMEDDDEATCIGDVTTGVDAAKLARLVCAARPTDEECLTCEYEARCHYRCACAAYTLTGRFGAVTPVYCWLQRCFIREADRLSATLWQERAPFFSRRFGLSPHA